MKRAICTIVVAVLAASPALGEPAGGGYVFVLKRTESGVAIERLDLKDGELKVLLSNPDTGLIDVILPVGRGGSGSMARLSDKATILLRCNGEELEVTHRTADGKEYKRPARTMSDLALYDVRVSVTAADGTRQAFEIIQNKRVLRDDIGPVLDAFGGKIPLSEGDYVLFTNTYHHSAGSAVYGSAPLEFDRWPIVRAKLGTGAEADFIVDIGAVGTVLGKSFLPPGVKIEQASMVEYSSFGKKLLKYTPGGATGKVESVLGYAKLARLSLGALVFPDVTVDVMENIPDIFGRPIAGILGLNVLRRAEVLSLGYPAEGRAAPLLQLAPGPSGQGKTALELPFSFAKSAFLVSGEIGGTNVHFLLDTGAPSSILDAAAAEAAHVEIDMSAPSKGRGLDGKGAQFRRARPITLTIGGRQFLNIDVSVSDLFAFSTMRTSDQHIGLMGNSFFARFARMEIDFGRRVVRFVE
jgi:hypothetical protein